MRISRKRIAQVCLAATAAAVFAPWQAAADGAGSTSGNTLAEGQIVFIVGVVSVGLVQAGWRPAWIGAGFAAAVTIRRILDSPADPAAGLWIAAAATVVAAVLLVWDMFANVAAPGDDTGGKGLSGPLGRRR